MMPRSGQLCALLPPGEVLPGVPADALQQFLNALAVSDEDYGVCQRGVPRPHYARTSAGGYGCFDMRPRRLVDLGLMWHVRMDNTSGVAVCVGDWRLPMTEARFLGTPAVQHNACMLSLRRYDRALQRPLAMTRAGALALCHHLGPNGLAKWAAAQEPETTALWERCNGLF